MLLSVVAIVATAAASAAGFAPPTRPQIPVAAVTTGPMAVARAAELARYRDNSNASSLVEAHRYRVQRASARAHRQKTAAAALATARADAAAAVLRARAEAVVALTQARAAAATRAARKSERQGLLARAQSNPRAVGRLLAADRGWEGEQFDCLDSLWNKESGWRWDADNPSSDAYGIPQSLPGSKMASVASDWETNPTTQIKWGLNYISSRYGTPCSAWAKSQAVNWY